jgi:hypothetical protein
VEASVAEAAVFRVAEVELPQPALRPRDVRAQP